MFDKFPFVLFRPFAKLFGWNRDKMRFPSEVGGHGKWCMERAKEIIGAHHKLRKAINGRVVLIAPQRDIGGRPAYQRHGRWIGGLCALSESGDYLIEVCWSPTYIVQFLIEVLLHEFGHAWLFTKAIFGHDRRFDGDFHFWRESRQATGVSINMVEVTDSHIEIDNDGVRWIVHSDPVPDQPVAV